jgi:hypothetical protein
MESRDELEKRVAALERRLAAGGGVGFGARGGIRKRATWGIGSLPFYDIAVGPDLANGEMRGHARGVIAIGDIATGVLAIGGLSRGVVALGGLAVGAFSFGGLSIGALIATGGLAIGGLALGGGAAGGVAVGGGAIGYYSCGGGAIGPHAIDARQSNPDAEELFRQLGLSALCHGRQLPHARP